MGSLVGLVVGKVVMLTGALCLFQMLFFVLAILRLLYPCFCKCCETRSYMWE